MSTATSIGRERADTVDADGALSPKALVAAPADDDSPQRLTVRWSFARLRRAGGEAACPPNTAIVEEGEVGLVALVSSDGAARVSAWIEDATGRRELLRDRAARARRMRWDGNLHVELTSIDAAAPVVTLAALFRVDPASLAPRMVYARCDAPTVAGLAGATYEIAVATLAPG